MTIKLAGWDFPQQPAQQSERRSWEDFFPTLSPYTFVVISLFIHLANSLSFLGLSIHLSPSLSLSVTVYDRHESKWSQRQKENYNLYSG